MRYIIVTLFALASLQANAQNELNVLTFNIRYNNPGDSLNAWPYRIDKCVSQIRFHAAHIIGVQEALHGQLEDLINGLKHYKYVGVGRDGATKGEYSAILFDTTRLQVIRSGTFWLSDTPDSIGRKGWDASFPRIVTWALFLDRKTKQPFYHFNTHFDHMGKVARRESAVLLLRKVAAISGKMKAIITGDFNAQPTDEPIRVITDSTNALHLTDSRYISAEPHYGPSGTFNGFQSKEIHDGPIDYIFLKGKITVLQHATLSQSWQGRFSSDHFPVFARLRLR